MKTLALFNNKGGVGKTSLAYHLGFMFAELGKRVVFADLDPQANLSTMCLTEDRLEAIWAHDPRSTIYRAIEPLRRGVGDVVRMAPEAVSRGIAIVTGDHDLRGARRRESGPRLLQALQRRHGGLRGRAVVPHRLVGRHRAEDVPEALHDRPGLRVRDGADRRRGHGRSEHAGIDPVRLVRSLSESTVT